MPKFLGLETKWWLWIGAGVAALLIVTYAMRQRGGAGAGSPGGGMDFGPTGPSAPPSYAPESSGDAYAAQLFDLERQAGEEELRQSRAMFDLQTEAFRQELSGRGFQLDVARQFQELQMPFLQERFETERAAQEVITRTVKGKKKVECPKGEHLVVTPEGGAVCQPLGGGGIGRTVSRGFNDIIGGFIQGLAGVAPAAGQYYGAQWSGLPSARVPARRPSPVSTPPISPYGYTPMPSPYA